MAVRRRRGATATNPDDDAPPPPPPASSSSRRRQQQPNQKHKQKKQKGRRFLNSILQSLHPQTRRAVVILLVAMLTGIMWNWWDNDDQADADPTVRTLLRKLCQATTPSAAEAPYCHPSLVPDARTQKAVRFIPAGQVVLKVPREYQIWDLDAFVDNPVVRQELVHARIRRHSSSVNHRDEYYNAVPLPAAAFLAAHLALLQHNHTNSKYKDNDDDDDDDDVWQSYFNVLPTFEQYQQFHPLLWERHELQQLLGGTYPYAYTHVMAFRQLLHDEYIALTEASTTFDRLVSQTDYLTARLHVMTRSFGTGPVDVDDDDENDDNVSAAAATRSSMQAYADATGTVSLNQGFHAMVPILDLYNHHAHPNVGFLYDSQQQAFVITAVADIAAGDYVRDSYGKRTDADLFARYGFVNGDGSDWTQASLALWHTVQVKHPEQQEEEQRSSRKSWSRKERSLIARYLQYDDGYEQCVGPPSNTNGDNDDFVKQAWQLKRLKYQYLLSIAAADETRWVFHMSPRAKDARPDHSSQGNNDNKKDHTTAQQQHQQLPPALDLRTIHFDGNAIFGTCRLLTLTHVDYHGNATVMVKAALQSELGLWSKVQEEESLKNSHIHDASSTSKQSKAYHWLPPSQDALEYRTLLCVARMAATALQRFGMPISQQQQQIQTLSVGSNNWTVAHVRLGEMQSLDMLKQVAFAGLRRAFGEDALDSNDDYMYQMRDRPCPPQFLRALVEEASMDGLD